MIYKCCVLLSTYNGAKYIYEQLKSLYDQSIRNDILVYIRDDGSTDQTCDIINDFRKKHSELRIEIKKAKNVGVQKSFLDLMKTAPEALTYAFCDQDDYWNDDKLETAFDSLFGSKEPMMYFSNYEIVDSTLRPIKTNDIVRRGALDSITQILFQNRVPGCTMVFNKKLLDECNKIRVERIRMHDALVLAVAYLTGEVKGDPVPRIKYRQHELNTIGYRKKFPGLKKWISSKIKLIQYGDGYLLEDTARALLQLYDEKCSQKQRHELELIANCDRSILARIILAFSKGVKSQSNWKSTVSVRFKVLFHLM